MQYSIRHETLCHFDSPVSYSIRKLRITPREEGGVRIASWKVATPARSSRSVDAWGNTTHMLALTEAHDEISILVTGTVEIPDRDGPVVLGQESDRLPPGIYLAGTRLTRAGTGLAELARHQLGDRPDIAAVLSLIAALDERLAAASGGTELIGAEQSFALGCAGRADRVHLLIAACRSAGLPARFVCGYRLAERVEETCWADVWLEASGGWVGFDVQRAALASPRMIRLAIGRDYLDACPMRSVHRGGGREQVSVSVEAN